MPDTTLCRYCRVPVDTAARRCPHCTSWLTPREATRASGWLQGVGVLWLVISVIAATAIGANGLMEGNVQVMAVAVGVLMQGLLLGLLAVVIAERSVADPDPR